MEIFINTISAIVAIAIGDIILKLSKIPENESEKCRKILSEWSKIQGHWKLIFLKKNNSEENIKKCLYNFDSNAKESLELLLENPDLFIGQNKHLIKKIKNFKDHYTIQGSFFHFALEEYKKNQDPQKGLHGYLCEKYNRSFEGCEDYNTNSCREYTKSFFKKAEEIKKLLTNNYKLYRFCVNLKERNRRYKFP